MKHVLAIAFVLMGTGGFAFGQEVIEGSVEYGVDIDGRFCMAIDENTNGTLDGFADVLFVFSQKTPFDFDLSGAVKEATVLNDFNRVTLESSDGKTFIDLAIGSPVWIDGATNTYRLYDGIELGRYDLRNEIKLRNFDCSELAGGSRSAASTTGATGMAAATGKYKKCDHGGQGATACSLGEVCSVECGAGYYACCNDNGIFEDTCKCYPIPNR